MPFPRDDVYSAIKRFCVVERAIPSQVILTKTLKNEKNQRSVMQKVALQINCKLGGALWSLKIPLVTKSHFACLPEILLNNLEVLMLQYYRIHV